MERSAAPPGAALPTEASGPDPQSGFFDGIDTSIAGIADLAPDAPTTFDLSLKLLAGELAIAADFTTPQVAAGDLRAALLTDDRLIQQVVHLQISPTERANVLHELRIKRVQLNDALALASGLAIDASAPDINVVPRWGKWFDATITTRPGSGCTLERSWLENAAGAESDERAEPRSRRPPSTADRIELTLVAGSAKTPNDTDFTNILTRPYFDRPNIEQPFYDLRDASLRNAPQSPPAFTAHAEFKCGSAAVQVSRIVHTEYEDRQPVIVMSPLNIQLSSHAQVLLPGAHRIALKVTDDSFGSIAFLTGLCLPTGCVMPHYTPVDPSGRTRVYHLDIPHQLQQSPFTITARGQSGPPRPLPSMTSSAASMQAPQVTHTAPPTSPSSLAPKGIVNAEGIRMVGYPGLIPTPYYTPATDRIVPVDLKLPPPDKRRIAYLPGTGDAIPEALASIGLTPTILTVADLMPTNLAKYDTVILGVRTYNAQPDLHGAPTQALLDYAKSGGNVLVQYQTYEFTAADAPYPLTLGNAEKVVDETDPVRLLDPSSPLLTTPNRITPADFNNWVEERGHGFLSTWDPRYTALTETHDPGGPETAPQAPQLGGLITTKIGKGRWTYCAFALYRQLPEAVPGAYRLFVNLLNP